MPWVQQEILAHQGTKDIEVLKANLVTQGHKVLKDPLQEQVHKEVLVQQVLRVTKGLKDQGDHKEFKGR